MKNKNQKYFDYVMRMAVSSLSDNEIMICHGFLSPELGPGEGDIIGDYSDAFAWIETNDVVYHFSISQERPVNGKKRNVSKFNFYCTYQPTFVRKYSSVKAVRLHGKTGSNGPWSDILLQGKRSIGRRKITSKVNIGKKNKVTLDKVKSSLEIKSGKKWKAIA